MKLLRIVLAALSLAACTATAQVFDNTGNGMLNGTYYFRYVIYVVADSAGDLNDALAAYNTITFDGHGGYKISGTLLDAANNSAQALSVSGTYTISSSGFGYLSNPVSNGDTIYGLVANGGVFVGSSTEAGFNDLFIAAPIGSTPATNASLQGSYSLAYFNVIGTYPEVAYDALLQINPNGQGLLGTVGVTAYGNSSTPVNQSIANVKYAFSNGAANVTFPNSSTAAVAGQEYLYISPDGNFVFGGAPSGFDMFVGVRSTSSSTNFSGLFYQAGIDEDESQSGFNNLDSYYGSFNASNGTVIGHQRLLSLFQANPLDVTYTGSYPTSTSGNYKDQASSTQFYFGNSGTVRIGLGIGPFIGITAAFQAPAFTPSGVYLNPAGVVNAASSAPFTAGIARGELITLYGSNLASQTQVASSLPFPTTLGNVQVMINNVPAPIYVVSPTQVSVVVPYGTTTMIAQIQVFNNGIASNALTEFVNSTAPGVFTQPAGGIGSAAALHADNSLVTPSNPAQPGETISVFVTGLGDVVPTVPDGSAGPANPLSTTSNTINVDVSGVAATVTYSGLAPGLAGLYQLNFQIPTGLTAGSNVLDIAGPDSYTTEALIPIGSGQ